MEIGSPPFAFSWRAKFSPWWDDKCYNIGDLMENCNGLFALQHNYLLKYGVSGQALDNMAWSAQWSDEGGLR
jgi:hypothetical protein